MSDLSYEYTLSQVHPSRASAPSLHFDAHARGFLLDLVETILLTCCTRAPLHRAFDFFKDARLRMVGLTMPAGGTGAYQGYWRAVKYAIRAERMAPVWALTQEAKRRSFERSDVERVVGRVGGWEVGLDCVGIGNEDEIERTEHERIMSVVFGNHR